MKVLHIDASARMEGSHSRALSQTFINVLKETNKEVDVERIDLALDPPKHFGELEAAAVSIPESEHTIEMRHAIAASDKIVERVLAADALVIGTPMYNFGMPSTLKAFFDHLSRNGKTFIADENGTRGLLSDKRVVVLLSAGGAYGAGDMFENMDCLRPHITAILQFMGVSDITFITASPTSFAGPEVADRALKDARSEAIELAKIHLC
ncbi:FMN-dependent NADH-azoreductase [Glaciecola siphonariae]|uniref:FMN dependent NADH:quinone oxidoreductase n=1 Tax=Glaciecola siphonariae TaxID=521012 RepID=A0ABV9LR90_9ALTE